MEVTEVYVLKVLSIEDLQRIHDRKARRKVKLFAVSRSRTHGIAVNFKVSKGLNVYYSGKVDI